MLVKIEARVLIFPGTDIHFPSTSVPPGTFLRLWVPQGSVLVSLFLLHTADLVMLSPVSQPTAAFVRR